MKRWIFAAAGLAAIVGVGWAGVAVSHQMECANLEEDFVNSISAISTAGNMRILSQGPGDSLKQAADRIEATNKARYETLIKRIATECGERSAQTAIRKAAQAIAM
jgi:hypothetical protein